MSSNVYFNNSKVFSGITSYNELEDTTKTILVCSNPNLFAWGATANVGYYGTITIPLGY